MERKAVLSRDFDRAIEVGKAIRARYTPTQLSRAEKLERSLSNVQSTMATVRVGIPDLFEPVLHVYHPNGIVATERIHGVDGHDEIQMTSVLKRMVQAHCRKIAKHTAKRKVPASRV